MTIVTNMTMITKRIIKTSAPIEFVAVAQGPGLFGYRYKSMNIEKNGTGCDEQ